MDSINNQPPEPVVDSTTLEVHSIWDTIQGEGPFAGRKATFVRMAGCNICCRFCDSDYTSNRDKYNAIDLTNDSRFDHSRLIVITGGEPFRQNIKPFIDGLLEKGVSIQVETNGIICPRWLKDYSPNIWFRGLTIVCSPKTPKVAEELFAFTGALKYVVQDGYIADDGLPSSTLGMKHSVARPPSDWKGEIYIQPLDEQNEEANQRNLKAAAESCLKYDYRLCVQMHKLAGLD